MKRRVSIPLVVMVVFGFTFAAAPHTASALVTDITSDCNSVTVSVNSLTPSVGLTIQAYISTPANNLGGTAVPIPSTGPFTLTFGIAPQPSGTTFTVQVEETSGTTIRDITCVTGSTPGTGGAANAPGAVLVFNPNDGRVDPRAGDRLAIWCITSGDTPNLLIYGVASNSKGIFLATVNFGDLLKAKNPRYAELNAKLAKLLKSATPDGVELDNLLSEIKREAKLNVAYKRVGGNGTLIIVVDDQNNFTVSWTGGPYGANGQGVWAKSFKCAFKR